MDSLLCDELLIEIFHRLQSPASSSSFHHQVSLVSKRWLRLSQLSTTCLNLTLVSPPHLSPSFLSSFLSRYPFLSSLSLTYSSPEQDSFDLLLLAIVACLPPNLNHLILQGGVPISPTSLSRLLASSFPAANQLQSLALVLPRPLNFSSWLPQLPSLKTLIFLVSSSDAQFSLPLAIEVDQPPKTTNALLPIENLNISGINRGDVGMRWLWRSCCGGLRRIRMSFCEGVGLDDDDCVGGGAFFPECLRVVEEVELRSCRPAVAKVLTDMAGNCERLNSLLIYDGGSRQGLLHFFLNSNSNDHLRKVDLRLPLDLDDQHLQAMASRLHNLTSVRLQSCVLSTGDGLKSLIIALSATLEELSLINCDIVHKVPGLLTTLTQNLRHLKRLDLSQNENLSDKEVVSMLASCSSLLELKLRGCRRVTSASINFLPRICCNQLQSLDIMCCSGIQVQDNVVDILVLNLPRLRRVEIEECKVSQSGWRLAECRWIQVVAC